MKRFSFEKGLLFVISHYDMKVNHLLAIGGTFPIRPPKVDEKLTDNKPYILKEDKPQIQYLLKQTHLVKF